MNIKGIRIVVLLVAAALGACLNGCTSQAQQLRSGGPRFGIVSLDRILPQLDEYRQFSNEYVQDVQRIRQEIGNDPKKAQEFMKDEQRKLVLEQTTQKWDETRRKFLSRLTEDVRAASSAVAKEKGIDIVLVNAPWNRVREHLAVDITVEVLLVLQEKKAGR